MKMRFVLWWSAWKGFVKPKSFFERYPRSVLPALWQARFAVQSYASLLAINAYKFNRNYSQWNVFRMTGMSSVCYMCWWMDGQIPPHQIAEGTGGHGGMFETKSAETELNKRWRFCGWTGRIQFGLSSLGPWGYTPYTSINGQEPGNSTGCLFVNGGSNHEYCQVGVLSSLSSQASDSYLSCPDYITVIHATVTFRMDYCNLLNVGLLLRMTWKVQLVQNAAVPVLMETLWTAHIRSMLNELQPQIQLSSVQGFGAHLEDQGPTILISSGTLTEELYTLLIRPC